MRAWLDVMRLSTTFFMIYHRLLILLLLVGLMPGIAPARALAQRTDGLDQPLTELNRCGPGDGSETHFTLAATGDTFPHENIQAVGEAQGYAALFEHVRPFLQAADLGYTNFDGAMLASSPRSGYPLFNFNPALAPALRDAGIGLVSTANNHILDRGPEGLDATLAVLDAHGILQHGAVRSDAAMHPPYLPITLDKAGVSLTLGFVSATWGTNGIPDPFGQVNLLYETTGYGEQGVVRQSTLDAVAAAAAATDLVVVAAHWGFEYQFYPHPSQIEAARRLAAAGADVILGAQSHTLQPVEWITTGERQTLVIYSLANFLASQGAFQSQSFSATSVIFYVGIARAADGTVRVTGYRYLPTIHIDGDTRPAPLDAAQQPAVLAHVRTIMRDPTGLRQVSPELPPDGWLAVCPPLSVAEAPQTPIPGDFALHYQSLGGALSRPPTDALAALGLPLGSVHSELTADCRTSLPVLYTERQRLELHAATDWPYRVVGTHLGSLAFSQRYPGVALVPRTDLTAADAFADSRFRLRYEQLGGLAIFGYPISGPLNEDHPETGVPTTVQYFERARFELAPSAPPGAPLGDQVRLGLLGREIQAVGGLAAYCGGALSQAAGAADALLPTPAPRGLQLPTVSNDDLTLIGGVMTQLAQGARGWIPVIFLGALLIALLTIAYLAFSDWHTYQRRGPRRGYRLRRSAYERFAGRGNLASTDLHPMVPPPQPAPPSPPQTRSDGSEEDDLLRQLLGQD